MNKCCKYIFWGIAISWMTIPKVQSQENNLTVMTPHVAVKANMLSYAATTLQAAVEVKFSTTYTLEVPLSYNPWSFSNNKKMKHFLLQPELRYWFCEAFNGTFVGLHAHYGLFNVGGIGVNDFMKEHRHEGWLLGTGVSVGHQWILSSRLSIEATVGAGYAYMDYEQYSCGKCAKKIKDKTTNYFGPTKLGISLIYIIN